MNIVEQEAENYFRRFYRSGKTNDIENLKDSLDSKLYQFNRDRDKLDFLKILRQKSVEEKDEHMKKCSGCGFEKERLSGIFVIDQEIESINRFYDYQPTPEDSFTPEEETDIHNKLNDIIEKLNKQGFGQEVIFNEIEELKNHFNLGKKNWFQLFRGKLIDLSVEKVLDETVIKEIHHYVTENFDQVLKLVGK